MTHLLSEKGWTKQQMANCINDFTMADLQQFIPKLLTQGIFIESVIFGNLTQQVSSNAFAAIYQNNT